MIAAGARRRLRDPGSCSLRRPFGAARLQVAALLKSESVLDEFTLAWERGQAPAVEEYLERLDPADCRGAVELIYREFCLAEAAGTGPDPPRYLSRFPRHADALEGSAAGGCIAACSTVVARPLGRVGRRRSRFTERRRRDRPIFFAPRAGAWRLRPRFFGRAVEPRESTGRRESDDSTNARALAASAGAARQHRRNRVARHG